MEIHPDPVVPALRRSDRLKRKHDAATDNSKVLEERPRPSKRIRAKVPNESNIGGDTHTSSGKDSSNRTTPKYLQKTENHPEANTRTLRDGITSNQKPRRKGRKKQAKPSFEETIKPPKRSAEAMSTEGPDLCVDNQPMKRRCTGIMSQAHKPTVLDRAPPTNTSVQFNPDSVKETEEVNIHSLPPELLSGIIEQLWADGHALSASALTCSTWRAAARPFVYRKIIIRNNEDMIELAHQIQYEPRIAHWIRTLRFEGKSVPRGTFSSSLEKSTELDIDTWIYPFFSIIGTRLPNIRNLELFGFQHLSLRQVDCRVFAEWIVELSRLNTVESLHLARCEMPPNALAAIIRSFPHLRNVALTCVGCRVFAQNGAKFVELSMVSPDSVHTTQFVERLRDGALKYPVFQPPPRLHSLSIDNDLGDYSSFDFKLLENWLHPTLLADSLRYLHAGGLVDWFSVTPFVKDLGASSALTTLRLFVETGPMNFTLADLDLSNLVNLERLILDCPKLYLTHEAVQCMCILLGQVNPTSLEEIVLCISAEDELDCMKEVDKSLCMDKFHDLKRFNLSIEADSNAKDWDMKRTMILAKSIFPGVEARGILHLIAPQKAQLP